MLIEFRGSGLWNHHQVNSVSSRRKQIFWLPTGNFTHCLSDWFDVFTYSSRWRGAGEFLRLQAPAVTLFLLLDKKGQTQLKMHGNMCSCKCSCTHAACLVVSTQRWMQLYQQFAAAYFFLHTFFIYIKKKPLISTRDTKEICSVFYEWSQE